VDALFDTALLGRDSFPAVPVQVEVDTLEQLASVFHFIVVVDCDQLAGGHEEKVTRIADSFGPR
jgi:hypothetical protein